MADCPGFFVLYPDHHCPKHTSAFSKVEKGIILSQESELKVLEIRRIFGRDGSVLVGLCKEQHLLISLVSFSDKKVN